MRLELYIIVTIERIEERRESSRVDCSQGILQGKCSGKAVCSRIEELKICSHTELSRPFSQ